MPVSGPAKFKVLLREILARFKATLDILTGNEPKFLGEKIQIK
jgi:vancomycin permeability regulator SanA